MKKSIILSLFILTAFFMLSISVLAETDSGIAKFSQHSSLTNNKISQIEWSRLQNREPSIPLGNGLIAHQN